VRFFSIFQIFVRQSYQNTILSLSGASERNRAQRISARCRATCADSSPTVINARFKRESDSDFSWCFVVFRTLTLFRSTSKYNIDTSTSDRVRPVAHGVELYFPGNYRVVGSNHACFVLFLVFADHKSHSFFCFSQAAGFLFLRFLCPAIFAPVSATLLSRIYPSSQRHVNALRFTFLFCHHVRSLASSVDVWAGVGEGRRRGAARAHSRRQSPPGSP
jgi:hypothetical protein